MAPTTAAMNDGAGATSMEEPFGPGCTAVPADGAGSFAGMAQDPAATAASNNPVLSTLVSAVGAADLVDTLNGPGPFTIFAPANDAFAKIDKATLDSLLADPKGDLTNILTYHVVAGEKLDADQLVAAGTVKTVAGRRRHGDQGRRHPQGQRLELGHLRQRPDGQRHGVHHRRRAPARSLIPRRGDAPSLTPAGTWHVRREPASPERRGADR